MKTEFQEYHLYSKEELKQLWESALFVFDANTLLNMYRYSRETVDEYINALEILKKQNRVWLPYQAGYEFYENRLNVITKYTNSYDEIIDMITKFKDGFGKDYFNHPFLDITKIRNDVATALADTETHIQLKKSQHPEWIKDDDVLRRLNDVFEACTGKKYDDKKLKEIFEEGEGRYQAKVPPGYKDADKGGTRQYGDLILWKEMIDKAKVLKRPVIFISGDVKEDWWLYREGQKVMPRPELKKEMMAEAGVDFHIYTAYNFLDNYRGGKSKDVKVSADTISEVRRITETQEQKDKENIGLPELPGELRSVVPSMDAMLTYELVVTMSQIIEYLGEIDIPSDVSEKLYVVRTIVNAVSNRFRHNDKIPRFYEKKLVQYGHRLSNISESVLFGLDLESQEKRELKRLTNVLDTILERL